MPAINPPILGGGAPAASSYPKFTFLDGTGAKFGLALGSGTTGPAHNMGAAIPLGTATADLEGILLQPTLGFNRFCAISLLLDGNVKADWIPFSNSLGSILDFPLAIPNGTVVSATVATNTNIACTIVPHPYQADVTPSAVSAAAIGVHTNVLAQGVTLAEGAPDTWGLIGSLPADTDALMFGIGPGNKGSGRGSKISYIDIGISTSGGSSPDYHLMDNLMVSSGSISMFMTEWGPFRFDGLLSGMKLWARAIDTDGVLLDPISVQAVAYLKGP